jgi:hypothetical protein
VPGSVGRDRLIAVAARRRRSVSAMTAAAMPGLPPGHGRRGQTYNKPSTPATAIWLILWWEAAAGNNSLQKVVAPFRSIARLNIKDLHGRRQQ